MACLINKKWIIKIVSSLMVALLIFACIPAAAYADVTADSKTQVIIADGIVYEIISQNTPYGTKVTIVNDNDLDKVVLIANEDKVKATTYEFEGFDRFGNEEYSIEANASGKIPDEEATYMDVFTAQFDWYSKTRELWADKYWYQYGTSSYGNTYMQIGCNATYQIPIYKLSSGKRAECTRYAAYIRDCNAHMNKAKAFIVSSNVAAASIALVGIAASLPIAVVVGALATALGIGVPGLADLVDSYYSYQAAKEQYFIIRCYGLSS